MSKTHHSHGSFFIIVRMQNSAGADLTDISMDVVLGYP
jgi:hypothetical protein